MFAIDVERLQQSWFHFHSNIMMPVYMYRTMLYVISNILNSQFSPLEGQDTTIRVNQRHLDAVQS